MKTRGHTHPGVKMAQALRGAWRRQVPPLAPDTDLPTLVPLALSGGVGALLWRRVADTPLARSPEGEQLRNAYRLHTLQVTRRLSLVGAFIGAVLSVPARVVHLKGWTLATLYPEPGLRPFGDVDLWLVEGDARSVEAVASRLDLSPDVHLHLPELDDRPMEEVLRRTRTVRLAEAEASVLGHEDHLRFLCLHSLRHGLARPLWLCDVALLVETAGAELDWEYLVHGEAERTRRVLSVIALAHRLLGARLRDAPPKVREWEPPRWLLSAVLRNWARPYAHRASLRYDARERGLLRALYDRWPDPVSASVRMGAPFNNLPRLPFQVADLAQRALNKTGDVLPGTLPFFGVNRRRNR